MIKNGVYMNRNNYKFGKLLKNLRQKNNMTQEDLAYRSLDVYKRQSLGLPTLGC